MAQQVISNDPLLAQNPNIWVVPDTKSVIDSLCLSLRGIFLEHLNKKNECRSIINDYFFTTEQKTSFIESECEDVEDFNKISTFMNHLLLTIDACVEICILLKIYLDRFLEFTEIPLCSSNWKDLVILSTLTAQRIYSPNNLCNSAFASYFPEIDRGELDFQEIEFLRCLNSQIKINVEDYESCFHHLSLVTKNDSGFKWKIKIKDVTRITQRSAWLFKDYDINEGEIVRVPKMTLIDLDELDLLETYFS